MANDIDEMLRPVSEENPAGENKEYDPLFLGLSELATGTPSSQMGDSVVEGKEPDWRELRAACRELWESTRDLRVAVYYSLAGFALDGLAGFSEGLSLIEYLVKEQWDTFYPQLDPDDDNDPTERINILSLLSPAVGAFNDSIRFPNKVRFSKLVPGVPYTLQDYLVVTGELEVPDSELNEQVFRAEVSAVSADILAAQLENTNKIMEQVKAITDRVNELAGAGSISFETLNHELKRLKKCYEEFAETDAADSSGETDGENDEAQDTVKSGKAAPINLAAYMPANRKEALMMLEKGAAYFGRAEPTSPVPFLVKRAIRMANMSFLDLLGDIDSDAMSKGRELFGIRDKEESDSDNDFI